MTKQSLAAFAPSWMFFFRRFPRQTLTVIVMFLFSGLAEAFGAISVVPLLGAILNQGPGTSSAVTQLSSYLLAVGIQPSVASLLVIICLAMLCKGGLTFVAMHTAVLVETEVVISLRLELFRLMVNARWPFFIAQPSGTLTHAMSLESWQSGAAFRNLCQALASLTQVGVYAAVGCLLSWRLLAAGLLGGAVFYFLFRGAIRLVKESGSSQAVAVNAMARAFADALAGAKPLKVMAAQRYFFNYLRRQTERYRAAARQLALGNSAVVAFQEPVLTLLIALGLYFATTRLSIDPAALLAMAFFFQKILSRISSFQQIMEQYAVQEGGLLSLLDKIARAEKNQEAVHPGRYVELSRRVRLENVTFGYADHPLFENFGFSLPVGSITALCGPSGSGKSSIADLIAGLIRPKGGRILVDDVPLDELDMTRWRAQIGYVPQEVFLFNDTIRNNVSLGRECSDGEVLDALRRAGAEAFVHDLPDGLDSGVGEQGRKLSGGQRQRLMIARALVDRPRLLILDEATSGLDPETERAILDSLSLLRKDMALLVISHQQAVRSVADNIVYVGGGAAVPFAGVNGVGGENAAAIKGATGTGDRK